MLSTRDSSSVNLQIGCSAGFTDFVTAEGHLINGDEIILLNHRDIPSEHSNDYQYEYRRELTIRRSEEVENLM
uniref:WGS project CBMG000000000 data, contig CS5907-c002736 n=1 Tax=Fusarium acuminatum CS5907 TaxID=1318461 RepID=A0A090MDU4_9HYPO|nr:unnamed protein product [Fusarium acuminatum CS5907]